MEEDEALSHVVAAGGGKLEANYRTTLLDSGQQAQYAVLSESERARGFVRPVRYKYVHMGINPHLNGNIIVRYGQNGCGAVTHMHQDIAQTHARDPGFYTSTFCVHCGVHRPLAEFVWDGTQEKLGS